MLGWVKNPAMRIMILPILPIFQGIRRWRLRQAIDKATAQAVKDFRALWASLAELGAVYDVTLAPNSANHLASLRASLAATAEGLRMTGVDIPR